MCGKDTQSSRQRVLLLGSPPHVREGRPLVTCRVVNFRITPACAGRTYFYNPQQHMNEDYPRSCGKDDVKLKDDEAIIGSPPLVREGRKPRKNLNTRPRITPAYAGRTHLPMPDSCRWRDHPRVCGNDKDRKGKMIDGVGSLPRVREGLR